MPRSAQTSNERFAEVTESLKNRILGFDVLRGLAVTWVIWHNVDGPGRMSPDLSESGFIGKIYEGLGSMGWIGVQLFFVLSGFLITGILLDSRGKPRSIRNFYARRTLRIFPPYYFTLLVLLVLVPLVLGIPDWLQEESTHQVWYWLYLSNWAEPILGLNSPGLAHMWTLAVEEQFYLLWPLCVLFLDRNRLAVLCVALVLIATLFRCGIAIGLLDLPELAAYQFTIARCDALAIGALLALAVRNPTWFMSIDSWARYAGPLSALWMVGIVAVLHGYSPTGGLPEIVNQAAAAVLSAWIVLRTLTPGTISRTVISGGLFELLRRVGVYSYAMYLFHRPVQYTWDTTWRFEASGPYAILIQLANVVAVFFISLGLAMISWHLLEGPCLRLKSRFTSEAERQAPGLK